MPRVEQVSACLQKLKSGWIHFRALANEMLSTSRLPSTPRFPSDLSLAPATAHLSETVRASSQPASQPAWEPKIGTLRGFHVGVTHWKNNLFRRWKRSWLAGELEQSVSFRHTFLRGLLAPSRMPAAEHGRGGPALGQTWEPLSQAPHSSLWPLSREVCSGVTGSATFGVQTREAGCVGAGEAGKTRLLHWTRLSRCC